MHEGVIEGVGEVPKKNIDQGKVLKVQVEVMKLMGYDSDEKALEYVTKYAAEFRNLVNSDSEIQEALSEKNIEEVAQLIVGKLDKEIKN